MFYKYESESLMSGPFVQFPNGMFLHPDHLTDIEMPYEGWHFFETEEQAKEFFGIE